jgi:hypothetical protein
MVVWYLFPVLVCCTKKNLAALVLTHIFQCLEFSTFLIFFLIFFLICFFAFRIFCDDTLTRYSLKCHFSFGRPVLKDCGVQKKHEQLGPSAVKVWSWMMQKFGYVHFFLVVNHDADGLRKLKSFLQKRQKKSLKQKKTFFRLTGVNLSDKTLLPDGIFSCKIIPFWV